MEISRGDIIRYLNSQGGGTVTGFSPDGKILVLDNNIGKQKGLKVVFIHGKGDGTLRLQLIKLIMKEFPTFSFSDASFTKYGMYGATEVTIQ